MVVVVLVEDGYIIRVVHRGRVGTESGMMMMAVEVGGFEYTLGGSDVPCS